ncbi:MAG: fibronectin type III domain-containing protein [Candidatus Aminicenantales bacterium]
MKKRAIVIFLAVSVAFLVLAGATMALGPQAKKSLAQTTVILHPPDGWTTPVNVSHLAGESDMPMLAVDDNGKAYVCWQEWYGNLGDPRSNAFNTNVTGQWGTTIENFLDYVAIDDVGFPVVTCDPSNGTGYMAYHDGDLVNQDMEVKCVEFTQGVQTSKKWISLTPNASDYATLAVNPVDKTVYCMWFDDLTDTVLYQLVYRWRDPATKQWSSTLAQVPVFPGRSKYWRDMVIDNTGTAHLVFIVRSPAELFYTKNPTPQNQNTWTTPISLSGDTGRDWMMPRIAADKDGDVYIVWYANTGGYETQTEEVWFNKTVNGVWQTKENLSNSPGRSEGCCVAVDPVNKDVYVAYHELLGTTNWEVYLRIYASQTTGAAKSWSDIYNMTNDSTHSAEPIIRIDAKRGLHLVYHDYVGENREVMYMYKQGVPEIMAQPPLSPAVVSALNAAEAVRTNTLSWAANPANAGVTIANYKIYRKIASAADSTFASIGQAGASALQYVDTGLASSTRYAYRLTTVLSSGEESVPSDSVTDGTLVFAPVNVAITTAVTRIVFYQTKDNTITWSTSPNNASSDVAGYDIYRKNAGEDDTAFTKLNTSSLSASTFSYTEAKLVGSQKYTYALKTKFKDGRESTYSAAVSQQK